jgi:hypothetical protein
MEGKWSFQVIVAKCEKVAMLIDTFLEKDDQRR